MEERSDSPVCTMLTVVHMHSHTHTNKICRVLFFCFVFVKQKKCSVLTQHQLIRPRAEWS